MGISINTFVSGISKRSIWLMITTAYVIGEIAKASANGANLEVLLSLTVIWFFIVFMVLYLIGLEERD